MNSFINIQVRILAQQAMRQAQQMQNVLNGQGGAFANAARNAQQFGRGLGAASASVTRFGSQMQWTGRQISYNFTLPIVAAGAAAMKWALENEAAMVRVTKVYGDGTQSAQVMSNELKALEKNFEALSNAFGVHRAQVIGIAADWAAAGASGIALAKATELTLQTMILGEMEAKTATQALIAIQAQYGQSTRELAQTIGILNMVENQTGISLSGLVDGFARAAGTARSAGVDVRHLAAMLAALTPAAGSAAQAGNALKTIFSRLLSPTKEATEVLGLMGINIGDLQWKSSTVTDRLIILAKAFNGLSDSQKGVVSSVVASRWQINKFEVLMRDLLNTNGFYAKALKSTADAQAVYTQTQRELNTVLSSNPRRLQMIWTLLQNALADIIQPMIPFILALAGAIATLANKFSSLDPGVQKLVASFLLFLAVVGPIIRYIGATLTLVGSLGRAFALLSVPIGAVAGFLWTLISVPVLRFLMMVGGAMRLTIAGFALLGPAIAASMSIIQSVIIRGAAMAGIVWRAGFGLITTISMGILAATQAVFTYGMLAIQRAIIAGAAAAGVIWRGLMTGMALATALTLARIRALFIALPAFFRTISTAVMAAMTGPWGAALAVIIVLVFAFWDELKAAWQGIIKGTVQIWNALPAGIKGSLQAVVNLVRSAVMAIYKLFSWMNPWARHSPSLVENVTTGMDEIGRQFARAKDAADVFRQAGMDLEEFGQHVRRLQAVADANEWADLRKELSSIAPDAIPSFDRLVSVMGPLRDLLQSINVELRQQQSIVDGLKPALDAANAAYNEQRFILDELERAANALQDQLDAAKQRMEDFANAPIEGMKAMSDAIFANTMEQKKLQLELMKMEDAVGPLDKLQGKLNAISGEMELLRGEQSSLREAGAGSEILSQYDDQINILREQQKQIEDQVKPLQDLSDAIDELGRKGQELDLENSLKFDPLKRQIDDVVNSMKELPFDQILEGVTANKAEVDRLTEAYDKAKAAVDAQKAVVDQLEAARDSLQHTYDLESDKLEQIKNRYQEVEDRIRSIEQAFRDLGQAARDASGAGGRGMSPGAENFLASAGGNFPDPGGFGGVGREQLDIEDQSKMIDDFTKEIADKTKNMFGLFDFLDPIKRGWNKGMDWLKQNIAPAFSIIGDTIAEKVSGLNPFEGMSTWVDFIQGVFGTISGFLSSVWRLVGPDVMELWTNTWNGLKDAFKTIQPEIEKFRDLIGPAGEMMNNIWTVAKPLLAVVLGLVLLVVKALISALAGGIGPFIRGLADLIGGLIRILRGIIEFVVGVFTGDWEMAWNGIKDIFLGLWDAISGAVSGIVQTIIGLIWGLVKGIWDFFVWLKDELVGHSIIPDMINLIKEWWDKLVNWTREAYEAVKSVIMTVVNWAKEKFDEWLEKVRTVRDKISDHVHAMGDVFWYIVDKIREVWNDFVGYIDKIVDKMNGIKDRFSFGGMFDGIKWAFKSAMNWVIGKWNDLSFGVGDVKISTPDIPYMARGGVTDGVAIVGEGRANYPEYVIPTDPNYRKRAIQLFSDLGAQLGVGRSPDASLLASMVAGQKRAVFGQKVQLLASGGVIGGKTFRLRGVSGSGTTVLYAPQSSKAEYHFHGDLSFPNVSDGDDAEEFIKNLRALVGK